MDDHEYGKPYEAISEITPELIATINETRAKPKRFDRRPFMAQIVIAFGRGEKR
jgi:hypothetical protein